MVPHLLLWIQNKIGYLSIQLCPDILPDVIGPDSRSGVPKFSVALTKWNGEIHDYLSCRSLVKVLFKWSEQESQISLDAKFRVLRQRSRSDFKPDFIAERARRFLLLMVFLTAGLTQAGLQVVTLIGLVEILFSVDNLIACFGISQFSFAVVSSGDAD